VAELHQADGSYCISPEVSTAKHPRTSRPQRGVEQQGKPIQDQWMLATGRSKPHLNWVIAIQLDSPKWTEQPRLAPNTQQLSSCYQEQHTKRGRAEEEHLPAHSAALSLHGLWWERQRSLQEGVEFRRGSAKVLGTPPHWARHFRCTALTVRSIRGICDF